MWNFRACTLTTNPHEVLSIITQFCFNIAFEFSWPRKLSKTSQAVKMDPVVKYLGHCGLIFQIFGFQYFSVKSLASSNQTIFPSLAYTLYFILVLFVLMGQMVTFGYTNKIFDTKETLSVKTILNYFVQTSIFLSLVLLICVSLIQSYVTTPLTKKFYLNCIKISEMSFSDFRHPINHRQIRNGTFQYFFFIIFLFIASQYILYIYEELNVIPLNLPIKFFFFVPMFFLVTVAFKFIFFVRLINVHLETVEKLTTEILKTTLNFESFNLSVKAVRPIHFDAMAIKINKLRRIYNVIYENADILNRSMGASLLAITSVVLVFVTGSGFHIFLTIVGKRSIETVGGNF